MINSQSFPIFIPQCLYKNIIITHIFKISISICYFAHSSEWNGTDYFLRKVNSFIIEKHPSFRSCWVTSWILSNIIQSFLSRPLSWLFLLYVIVLYIHLDIYHFQGRYQTKGWVTDLNDQIVLCGFSDFTLWARAAFLSTCILLRLVPSLLYIYNYIRSLLCQIDTT